MKDIVGISTGDVHFTLQTLDIASSVIKQGLALATKHKVPFLINGDLLDGKAVIRGEIANRLIELLFESPPLVIINTGNHDALNQYSDCSSLNFLRPYAAVISEPTYIKDMDSWVIPYQHDAEKMKGILRNIPKGSRIFVHQGVMGADMGHYIKDSSSLSTDEYADFRTIASHYHKRQDIKCGRPRKGMVGLFSFLGSPYSVSFSEANEGQKGLNIVYEDGSLELVPCGLREHRIIECAYDELDQSIPISYPEGTLFWIKVRGPYSELEKLSKKTIADRLVLPDTNFKLDKIATESEQVETEDKKLTGMETLDRCVDSLPESAEQKKALKELAREVLG